MPNSCPYFLLMTPCETRRLLAVGTFLPYGDRDLLPA